MTRPRLPGFPRHLHIDPYLRVKFEDHSKDFNDDERVNKFLEWFDSFPAESRQRTAMAFELLLAATNGELGVVSASMKGGEVSEENKERLNDLLANMVVDET